MAYPTRQNQANLPCLPKKTHGFVSFDTQPNVFSATHITITELVGA